MSSSRSSSRSSGRAKRHGLVDAHGAREPLDDDFAVAEKQGVPGEGVRHAPPVDGDHGHAGAAEAREDVFRPFFRLDEARNLNESGTGLGLSIARDIARSHGGDIRLDDSPMGGLRAELRLPV